ncbi:uncharacterized protein CTRU02_215279 [Colletotrichum truncatum]|uniref:Uncharacterized protein n=1 Tax=Colletotrichum truncatum TaxID=5467 RepID=A0ACC3YDE6_COLTU|nr:uncharacterized protein CTRU02_12320 [Colletotrichum truncatum]KAF6784858.1 hypothetical protein CTRU02_12320 [Colletotrichum truncatum]
MISPRSQAASEVAAPELPPSVLDSLEAHLNNFNHAVLANSRGLTATCANLYQNLLRLEHLAAAQPFNLDVCHLRMRLAEQVVKVLLHTADRFTLHSTPSKPKLEKAANLWGFDKAFLLFLVAFDHNQHGQKFFVELLKLAEDCPNPGRALQLLRYCADERRASGRSGTLKQRGLSTDQRGIVLFDVKSASSRIHKAPSQNLVLEDKDKTQDSDDSNDDGSNNNNHQRPPKPVAQEEQVGSLAIAEEQSLPLLSSSPFSTATQSQSVTGSDTQNHLGFGSKDNSPEGSPEESRHLNSTHDLVLHSPTPLKNHNLDNGNNDKHASFLSLNNNLANANDNNDSLFSQLHNSDVEDDYGHYLFLQPNSPGQETDHNCSALKLATNVAPSLSLHLESASSQLELNAIDPATTDADYGSWPPEMIPSLTIRQAKVK